MQSKRPVCLATGCNQPKAAGSITHCQHHTTVYDSTYPYQLSEAAADRGAARGIIAEMEQSTCIICGKDIRADVHTDDAAEHGRSWHLFVYPDTRRGTQSQSRSVY